MRSKASVNGHPIHPALIPFPFAFMFGAFIFDVGGVILGRASWWTTGMHLAAAGAIAGIIAALPGVIDYFYTVPPESSAKTRATKHALANVSAVMLFGASFLIRWHADAEPSIAILAIETVGAGMLAVGGWMGGVLVSRNQISVDPRYADAGKWNEATIDAKPGESVVVAKSDELETDQMKLLHLDGKRIVVGKTEEGHAAFSDRCTHRGGSLAGGSMICGTVQCPWHGSQFDVRTGAVKAGPATKAIETYQIEEQGKEVRLTAPKKS